ncbi:cytochrome c oxidase assembly protein [Labedella populi]|uniref:cytochrome c oxidase assembly protein n=1 Tax=Labedella populi TaxID=2498850 RepID=UPI0014080B52|nr:cytochrome c oxidase assembly protein [Labedella populi]
MHHEVAALLRLDVFGVVVGFPSLVAYVGGVVTLRRRGDPWSIARSASFASGILVLLAVTCTPLGVHAMVTVSGHMLQHMALNMVVPMLLVLGGPLTLLLRTVPSSMRRCVVAAVHSSPVRFVTHPFVATTIFTGSLFLLYFTPLFEIAMSNPAGHVLMQAHFLASGYLFFWLVLGTDPGPGRPVEIARVPLVVTMAVAHTVFAFVVVFTRSVLAEGYFRAVTMADEQSLRADQALAGGIAWGIGELSTAVVIVILLQQWFARSERMEATRRRARRRAGVRRAPGGPGAAADEPDRYDVRRIDNHA